jgi:hypothetical protein
MHFVNMRPNQSPATKRPSVQTRSTCRHPLETVNEFLARICRFDLDRAGELVTEVGDLPSDGYARLLERG